MTTRRSVVALFSLMLAGCGLKGPLYIPPPEPEAETATESDGDEAAGETPEGDGDG